MHRHFDAIVKPDGTVQLLEPYHSEHPRSAILTILDDEEAAATTSNGVTTQNLPLGDVFRGYPRPKGATWEDLMPVYGTLDPEAAAEMIRIIEDEFERIEP